jgi:hypothetical protein
MNDPGHIFGLYHERKRDRGKWFQAAEQIRRAVNGEMVIPLPELDTNEVSGIANLALIGIDQSAMRIASQMPDINSPPLRPGIELSEEKARQRRLAMLAWWDMNSMQNILRQRARFYLGYGHTPVVIRPVSPKIVDKREIPFWRVYNPLDAYLPRPQFLGDMEPEDGIFCHEQSLAWVEARWPDAARRLCKGTDPSPDTKFEVLEYFDSENIVLMVIGKPRDPTETRDPYTPIGRAVTTTKGGTPYEVLENVPNRAEICPVVAPGRITLDRIKGAFDMIPAMAHKQGRLDALEYIAITRGVFPDQWAVTHPTSPTAVQVVTPADGLKGIIGEVQGGQIQAMPINPGVQTPQAIDRIERNQRVSAGIPAEYGGESPTNIRTARRGAAVLGSTVDMPIGEAQDVFAASLEAEDVRAVAIMKGYYGGKKTSFYVPRSGKALRFDYTPDSAFETDWHVVKYSMPGSDAASIPIELGQRTSTGEMSMQTSREIDPYIEDPIRERDQVEMEGLDRAILGGMEQQLALPAAQGGLDPVTVARIAKLRAANVGMYLHDAVLAVHQQMQAEQQAQMQAAQAAGPTVPGAMPAGAGPPTALGGGAPGAPPPSAGQPAVPAAAQGQQNLSQIMATLHRPVQQSAPERALAAQ